MFNITTILLIAVLSPGYGEVRGAFYPSLSPDGKLVSFSYMGDIWVAPIDRGVARRVTVSEGSEFYQTWSPDGRWIAFTSDRYGNGDVFVVPSDGSAPPRRLTYHQAWDRVYFWSEDSKFIYFGSGRTEFRKALYRISIDGGNPERVVNFEVSLATLIPGTDTILFIRGGNNWWRRKYRGSANWDIWKMSLSDQKPIKITDFDGRDGWPMFSLVDNRIYFVCNEGKDSVSNLWAMDRDGSNRQQLTHFKEDVLYPSISRDGRIIVFQVFDKLYRYDVETGKTSELKFYVPQDYKQLRQQYITANKGVTDFSVKPDGSEIAFVVWGDIYVMKLEDGDVKKVNRITRTPDLETEVRWHPEKEKLIYVSLRDGNYEIYTAEPKDTTKSLADAYRIKETRLTKTPEAEHDPAFSPDGKMISFKVDERLYVMDADGRGRKKIADMDVNWPRWSPDSRWIAFSSDVIGWREDIFVVPSDGSSEPVNITDNVRDDYKPMWSSDGRRIVYASRSDDDLTIRFIWLREDDERKSLSWWKEHRDSVEKYDTIKIDFDGIRDRVHDIATYKGGYYSWTQDPDGEMITVDVRDDDGHAIKFVDWLEGEKGEIILSSEQAPLGLEMVDKSSVYFGFNKLLFRGRKSGSLSRLDFKVGFWMTVEDIREAVFDQGWWLLQEGFYDPSHHGIDWKAMYNKYYEWAKRTRTFSEFERVFAMMLGELNASHLGIWENDPDAYREPTGILGIEIDPKYHGNGVKVSKVIKNSVADKYLGLKPGDIITEINGVKIQSDSNFYSYLRKKANKKVLVTWKSGLLEETHEREVKLEGYWDFRKHVYDNWVEGNREIVEKLSGGKIGYLHIRAMNYSSLKKFYDDVYRNRDKKALIIDVRYNGGGSTHDQILNFLSRVPYGYYKSRWATHKSYSPDFLWDKPAVVLINSRSYSDAEIFPMGFRQLKLGKLIGVPTFGAVIGTSNYTMLDGKTVVRMPFVGWYRLNGKNLENGAVQPDIYVENPPQYDNIPGGPQIEVAVRTLLKELGEE